MSKFEDFLIEFNFTKDYGKKPKRPKSHWDEPDKDSDNNWSVIKWKKDGDKSSFSVVKKFKNNEKKQAESYAKACNNKSTTHEFDILKTS